MLQEVVFPFLVLKNLGMKLFTYCMLSNPETLALYVEQEKTFGSFAEM